MYQVFPGIVIVLSAMFNLQLWSELEGKRCRYCYDYDKENFIQNLSFKCTCVPNAFMYLPKYYFPQVLPTNFGQTKHVSFSTKQATQPRKIFVEELWSATLFHAFFQQLSISCILWQCLVFMIKTYLVLKSHNFTQFNFNRRFILY